jgi:ATP-dependent DNA helicase UvrD/PcrA
MASTLNIEHEIYKCIDVNQSFILDAGAGSGKTWTLIQTLKYLIKIKSNILRINNQKIVCITYTNVAKNEILERIERNSLVNVSTIHDFLWSCIVKYKKELKEKLIEYLQEKLSIVQDKIKLLSRHGTQRERDLLEKEINLNEAINAIKRNNKSVVYKEYFIYKECIISHDDVIALAHKIFSSFKTINKIVRDTYPFILIDEYQDTQESVVKILCEHLLGKENFLLGFFGDKMQKIYDHGIGEIPEEYKLAVLKKTENFRCSESIINLLNNIRNDLKQFASGNNVGRIGSNVFYYSQKIDEIELINNYLIGSWNVEVDSIKILYLTHRLIARKNKYYDLFDLYNSRRKKDYLTDNKNNRGCPFANFLFSIGEIIELYETHKNQTLLKKLNLEINSFEDKKKIRNLLDKLLAISKDKSIEEIFNFIIDNNLIVKPEKLTEFDFEDPNKKEFSEELLKIPFKQFSRLYKVQQDDTPFSTKHGTKGDEFENVLVIIDDTAWRNSYNFNNYFAKSDTSINRLSKTKNLFYVVCSRAKNNLAILHTSDLSENAKQGLKELFGKDNYIEL